MEKLYSNILGTPVFIDDENRPATTVKDVILDPDMGKAIALVVNRSRNLVITPHDILSFGDVVKINSREAIIEGSEVIRVGEVLGRNIRIFGNKVETKEGEVLGRVTDYSLEMSGLNLQKIFVSKGFMGLIKYSSRIIPAKKIVEVLPDKIVVENHVGKIKEKKSEREFSDMAVS